VKVAYLGIKGLPSAAGADRVVEAIVQRLAPKAEVTVYCDRHYTKPETQIPGVRLILIPSLAGKHLRPLTMFILSACHAWFKGDYDLVHVHNAEAGLMVPWLRLRYGVLATSHGQAYNRDKWGRIAKRLLRLSDYFFVCFSHRVTSVSLPLAQLYQSRYGRSVAYIPNGVEVNPSLDEAAAQATLKAHDINGEYILFSAGRLDPTKGCHLALQAFHKTDSKLQFVVVGNLSTLPAYGQELRAMADERIRFIPFIQSRGELFSIVRRAQFLVFPSTVEAMSMVLLEAASLGVPIICSDIPENTSVMKDHAVYFKSGDRDDLADKMEWALRNRIDLNQLGLAGQKHVHENYNWVKISEHYFQLYRQLAA
jgi:glycosyltransferase involved in cell wall biosynthesis